ncbi:TMEM165/GDT1 family protein [Ancylothrix sp. C2]|uniref:TMEM165/GDT1 family protein n=1 Tax=Ancylothrix sp. D3o TaxID=2953691 RepID=UPI0021BA7433|nr:TMEM165/GDT1 family protein [Ancylothrix sp. D3o]MCT7951201.1 TMEM165/GDT1 family protein [Ancylothrix sp. D3o]
MLTAFTKGLLLITVSELGDKTFFIAAILAMRHNRRLVFIGVVAALAAMTILSVLIGKAASFLRQEYIDFAEIALFLGFGLKLLYDASKMPATSNGDELEEAAAVVEKAEINLPDNAVKKSGNLALALQSPQLAIVMQSFALTFVAEWGDRTQITTIALAASNDAWGVTLGAILGHSICALIAVMAGRLIAGRISERTVTAIGGGLFLIFGFIALIENFPK